MWLCHPGWGVGTLSPADPDDILVEGPAHVGEIREDEGVLRFEPAGDDVLDVFLCQSLCLLHIQSPENQGRNTFAPPLQDLVLSALNTVEGNMAKLPIMYLQPQNANCAWVVPIQNGGKRARGRVHISIYH